jgi:hypothetical protein
MRRLAAVWQFHALRKAFPDREALCVECVLFGQFSSMLRQSRFGVNLKTRKNRPFFLQGLGLDRPAAGLFNAPDEKTGKSRALGSPLMLE